MSVAAISMVSTNSLWYKKCFYTVKFNNKILNRKSIGNFFFIIYNPANSWQLYKVLSKRYTALCICCIVNGFCNDISKLKRFLFYSIEIWR